MPDERKLCRITIITACLNAAGTIEETIRSVLDQNYPNLEYIVIDGGSTDGTMEVVEKYRKRLTYVVSEPDKGIYDAFNKGLCWATGEVVGILNADDQYVPGVFKKIAREYEKNPDGDVFYGRLVILDPRCHRWKTYALGDHTRMTVAMSIPHPACFVTKKAYQKHGFFDSSFKISGDWDFMLRLYLNKALFRPIDEVLSFFLNSGISSKNSEEMLQENIALLYKNLPSTQALSVAKRLKHRYRFRESLLKFHLCSLYEFIRDTFLLKPQASGTYKNVSDIWKFLNESEKYHV